MLGQHPSAHTSVGLQQGVHGALWGDGRSESFTKCADGEAVESLELKLEDEDGVQPRNVIYGALSSS